MKLNELKDIIRNIVREEIRDVMTELTHDKKAPMKEVTAVRPVKKQPVIKTGNAALDDIFSTTTPLHESSYPPASLVESISPVGGEVDVPSTFSDATSPLPNFLQRDLKGILQASVKKSQAKNGPL